MQFIVLPPLTCSWSVVQKRFGLTVRLTFEQMVCECLTLWIIRTAQPLMFCSLGLPLRTGSWILNTKTQKGCLDSHRPLSFRVICFPAACCCDWLVWVGVGARTCSAAGAVQQDWRRPWAHLICTLRKQTDPSHNPEHQHPPDADHEGRTHHTALPRAGLGGAALWWGTTRGRQTPHFTHLKASFGLTLKSRTKRDVGQSCCLTGFVCCMSSTHHELLPVCDAVTTWLPVLVDGFSKLHKCDCWHERMQLNMNSKANRSVVVSVQTLDVWPCCPPRYKQELSSFMNGAELLPSCLPGLLPQLLQPFPLLPDEQGARSPPLLQGGTGGGQGGRRHRWLGAHLHVETGPGRNTEQRNTCPVLVPRGNILRLLDHLCREM